MTFPRENDSRGNGVSSYLKGRAMKFTLLACAQRSLAGCASTASKSALEEFSRTDNAYAQLVDMVDAGRYSVRGKCAETNDDEAVEQKGHRADLKCRADVK